MTPGDIKQHIERLTARASELEKALADPDGYCETMQGTDRDLAAHFTVTNRVGLTVFGPDAAIMFPPVPEEAYFDSLVSDVENMESDIAQSPVYCVLNLCRVLAYLTEDAVLSKQDGGEWGLTHLPEEYHPLLQSALAAYGGKALPEGLPLAPFVLDN